MSLPRILNEVNMKSQIETLSAKIETFEIKNNQDLESFRIEFLGTKGHVKELYAALKDIPNQDKKEIGQLINSFRNLAEEKFNKFKENLESVSISNDNFDCSRPGEINEVGSHHPISLVRKEIVDIFSRIGFSVSDGPEIEDDWHNFTALNFPPEHPARDMQDTFFVRKGKNEMALRTHTSSVQVRVMESSEPPIRTISPGRVYRNEAISARAHCFFHQIEGLYIDKGVTFGDLKQTLLYFAKEMFGEQTQIRLRPSYFPFTEPSAEVDVSCSICSAKGCNVCKHSGWLEILGCGMVDPNVLEAAGIDSSEFTGFAFGMGVERITQLKYKVNDLRLYSENDIRFLRQFRASW